MLTPVMTLGDVREGAHDLVAVCRWMGCRHRSRVDLPRTIQSVGISQALYPERAEVHFTDRMRCPSCKRRGMNLWLIPYVPKRKPVAPIIPTKEPNYRVISHGRHYPPDFQMIATADNLFVAKGAYAAAAHFYEGHWISLMQGAFLMDDNRRDGQPQIIQAEEYKRMREAESRLSALGMRPLDDDAKTEKEAQPDEQPKAS